MRQHTPHSRKKGKANKKPKTFGPKYQEDCLLSLRRKWDHEGDCMEFAAKAGRQFLTLQAAHREMLENVKNRVYENAPRIKRLHKIMKKLQDKFVELDKFIEICEKKETGAALEIHNELLMQKSLVKGIVERKGSLKQLCEFKEHLEATLKEMDPYESVTRKIVEEFDYLKSVKSFTNRCDSLMLAQVEVSELQQQKIKEIEELHKEMITETNLTALKVLGLNNELAQLERSYCNARAESIYWEGQISLVENCIVSNELKLYRLQDALQQIVRLLSKRLGNRVFIARMNSEALLDFIVEEILILKSVICCFEQKSRSKIINLKI